MRKRLEKKLSLSRETLGNLQAEQLGKVVGRGECTLEDITTCVCTDACDSGGTGTGGATKTTGAPPPPPPPPRLPPPGDRVALFKAAGGAPPPPPPGPAPP